MRNILLILFASILFISCSKEGEVERPPKDFIIIHGKTYKLMKIVPEDNGRAIWIMYPKDSLDKQPEVINWTFSSSNGKTQSVHSETLIKVD